MKSPESNHESLHDELVDRIVGQLRPIRRLWPVRVRLGLWIALEAGVTLLLLRYGRRPGLPEQLRSVWYVLGVTGFAFASAVSASFALRSAIPGCEPSRREISALATLVGASALLLLKEPVDASVPLTSFISAGLPCALGILMLAVLPCLALLWAVRRGVPFAAGRAGALVGAGAFLFSFALMRMKCPLEEGMHLLVWHLAPALAGIAFVACIGTVLFSKRSRD